MSTQTQEEWDRLHGSQYDAEEEAQIEARIDGIGGLVNIHHAITGKQCPRYVALGMATAAVSDLIFKSKLLELENERLKQHVKDLDSDLNAACQSEPDTLSEREALGER